jgi:hypothetical protein
VIGEDLNSRTDHKKHKEKIQPVTDSKPGGESVGNRLRERSGSWIGRDELLDFGKSSKKSGAEDGQSCTQDAKRDESEKDLPGGEPEGANPDFGEVRHFLVNSTCKFL